MQKQKVKLEVIVDNQDFSREDDLSLLHVYFKDLAMIKYNKDVIYSIEVRVQSLQGHIYTIFSGLDSCLWRSDWSLHRL